MAGTKQKITVPTIRQKKGCEKIVAVTAYDYPTTLFADAAGVDMILVGDSLGMVLLGYPTTLPVTMEEMLHHTKACARAKPRALLVVDMPYLSYQITVEDAVRNAGRFLQEGGAEAVKLEGGEPVAETIHRLVSLGIPVLAHLGMTPQSVHAFGGHRVQGKGDEAAKRLIEDAHIVEQAGAFAVVLELIPSALAKEITGQINIPTIGIGAGPSCDGQIQVLHDLVGLVPGVPFKHTKRYAHVGETITEALRQYAQEVRSGQFPTEEQAF
ncbi:MAG: 3-methyl-2-oxobutanoate hydroxymethyltransferase [Armatimonadota bacterium]|nr:3-methyl-2-oxobutanoate hydroxymethyltransferase [bacterium]MDW8320344.1 3-methyl-2-oxobutanoate hydroxymethyltransferase [Armatimonadota bacterium]